MAKQSTLPEQTYITYSLIEYLRCENNKDAVTKDLLVDWLAAILHKEPDGCGCRVKLGDIVFIHNLPHSANIRIGGQAFKLSARFEKTEWIF